MRCLSRWAVNMVVQCICFHTYSHMCLPPSTVLSIQHEDSPYNFLKKEVLKKSFPVKYLFPRPPIQKKFEIVWFCFFTFRKRNFVCFFTSIMSFHSYTFTGIKKKIFDLVTVHRNMRSFFFFKTQTVVSRYVHHCRPYSDV